MRNVIRPAGEGTGRVIVQAGVTSVAWIPPESMDLSDWVSYGRKLGTLGRGVAWWIGDWLRFGNSQYGERYARAARVTGYDTQSLMNMVYVASRFEPERRRESLSWSHHAELAALDPGAQDRWLDLAERRRLSVHCLRLELRALRKADNKQRADSGQTAVTAPARPVICPFCEHVIQVSD